MYRSLRKLILKPHVVFLYVATFFGIISVFMLPILEAPDENQHFQVEYAVFSSSKHAPKDIILNEALVLASVRDGSYKHKYLDKSSAQYDGFAINTDSKVFDGSTKSSVLDIMRLPQATGILVGRIIYPSLAMMVIMGRLIVLAVYIMSLYYIIKKLRHGKWVFVMIACLPMAIQQAGSLSYDAINLLVIFAWVAFIINLATQPTNITRKQIIFSALLVILLLLTKANNILLLTLIFALPTAYVSKTKVFKKIHAKKYWTAIKYVTLTIFGIILYLGIHLLGKRLLAGHDFNLYRLLFVLLNTFFWGDLGLIDVTVNGIVGEFSNFYYHLPIWMVVIAFINLTIVMLYEKIPNISKRFAIISGLLFAGSILLISVGMYYGWAMRADRLGTAALVTDGIQGRYFTPLLVLLFPCFAYIQKFIRVLPSSESVIPIIATGTSTLLLTAYTIQTWHFFWK